LDWFYIFLFDVVSYYFGEWIMKTKIYEVSIYDYSTSTVYFSNMDNALNYAKNQVLSDNWTIYSYTFNGTIFEALNGMQGCCTDFKIMAESNP
jgi:hypothetical protein